MDEVRHLHMYHNSKDRKLLGYINLLDGFTYRPEKGVQALGAQDPYPAATDLSLKPLTLFTSLGEAW